MITRMYLAIAYMFWLSVLLAIVVLFIRSITALLILGTVIWLVVAALRPAFERRARRRELAAARAEQIIDAQHQWALANVAQAQEDVQRHRLRLENDLDDLHREQR